MKRSKNAKLHSIAPLPDTPILLDRDGVINRLNKRLVDSKSGNYLIVLKSIGDFRRVNVSFEYYSDVKMHVVDTSNLKRTEGVTVPGLGPNPIDLNKSRLLYTNVFFDWNNFEEDLFEKSLKWQKSINEQGYYPKERK